MTWGSPADRGDSSAVQDQLKNVQQVQTTDRPLVVFMNDDSLAICQLESKAFAGILEDGSVVTWGKPACGGDSSRVQNQLKKVQQIQATIAAFAAILEDGSVVTWGDPACGGDSSEVQEQLRSVQQVQATDGAFAAILEDGSVVTWGNPVEGGDSSAVQHQLAGL